jgi:hypothetical protein
MPRRLSWITMPSLQIQPHSRHASGLAVAFLSLLAAGSFVTGLNHQLIARRAPSPFPAPALSIAVVPDAIPEAKPAPDMQIADVTPAPSHRAPKAMSVPDDDAAAQAGAATAAAPPALDASATAPEPPPAATNDAASSAPVPSP